MLWKKMKSNEKKYLHILKEEFMRKIWIFHDFEIFTTGKSFSEALIPASVDRQYDNRLFIEFPEKNKFTTCCVQILF